MEEYPRFNLTTFLAFVGGITGLLSLIWTISPVESQVVNTLGGIGLIALVTVLYSLFPRLRAIYTKFSRLVVMILIAFLIPVSQFFIGNLTNELLIATSLEAILIIVIIQVSREWRTVRPLRDEKSTREPFEWGGILDDEVGRGPGSENPDGAPDALFKLRPSQSGQILDRIILRRINLSTKLPTRQVWRTERHPFNFILGVTIDGKRIRPDSRGRLNLQIENGTELQLFASDDWFRSIWFNTGQKYEVELIYRNIENPEIYSLTIP